MPDLIVTPVKGELSIEMMEERHLLPRFLEEEVEEVWRSGGDHLFNGRVLSCIGFHDGVLIAKEVEYRQVYAAINRPALRPQLGVMPLAVTGIIRFQGEYLLGKRSESVTQYKGCWELVPSGSLDLENADDFRRQLLQELAEETGIQGESVEATRPVAVIHDMDALCVDICVELPLKEKPPLPPPNAEYTAWKWLRKAEMSDLSLVPTSEELLRRM